MTVQESTICSLIQAFPVLLILAQNHNRCLKTPLIYKPPTPTHSPEYYEALDALFHNLYGHGYHDHEHEHGYHEHDCHHYGPYHGKKIPQMTYAYTPCQYGHTSPHGYGYGHGHAPMHPIYGYKKINVYNVSGYGYGTKGTYVPYGHNQVYNVNHKYKVIVKRNKNGHRRHPQKLIDGFFENQRSNRRYENRNQFGGFMQNLFPNGGRFRPQSNAGPFGGFGTRPITNEGYYYDQYGRPRYPNYQYDNQNGNPVRFPSYPQQQPRNPYEIMVVEEVQGDPENPVSFPDNSGNNDNTVNVVNNQNSGGVNFVDNTGPNAEPTERPLPQLKPVGSTGGFSQFNPAPETEAQTFPPLSPVATSENPPLKPFQDLPPLTPVPQQNTQAPPTFPPYSPEEAPEPTTRLPALTPVVTSPAPPATEVPRSKENSFGNAGLFPETCETVDGGQGTCIAILHCEQYVQLLKESKTNPAVVQVLRKAHCGFEGSNPKVCCPAQGFSPAPPVVSTTPPPPTTTPPPPTTTTAAAEAQGKNAPDELLEALPEPPVCGVSNATFSRVVGGVNAKLGDFPWMAALGYKSNKGDTRWRCGGSLISEKHVLTAAHCIVGLEKSLYVVRLGELDLYSEADGAAPVDVLVRRQLVHEEYSPNKHINDIGLLYLDRSVPFTALIRPICIPKAEELRARNFEDYTPLVAGWGTTAYEGPSASHLQVVQLPVVSNDYCQEAYRKFGATIIPNILCAGFKKGGKDSCRGDSGGPLMQPIWNSVTHKTFFYQIGVVSYGWKCAEPGVPGVYSRVTSYVPWIEKNVLVTS